MVCVLRGRARTHRGQRADMEQPELPKEEGSLSLGCAVRGLVATWPLREFAYVSLVFF